MSRFVAALTSQRQLYLQLVCRSQPDRSYLTGFEFVLECNPKKPLDAKRFRGFSGGTQLLQPFESLPVSLFESRNKVSG